MAIRRMPNYGRNPTRSLAGHSFVDLGLDDHASLNFFPSFQFCIPVQYYAESLHMCDSLSYRRYLVLYLSCIFIVSLTCRMTYNQ